MKTTIWSDSGINVGARSGVGSYGWYVTFALMPCATLSFLDSQLPSFTYAFCALPIAKLSDRTVRKNVICIAIVVWRTMNAAAALVPGLATFALSREGVALGESALTPAANSIIADNTTLSGGPLEGADWPDAGQWRGLGVGGSIMPIRKSYAIHAGQRSSLLT